MNATPVTVLTGFLGAGKTTLINRLLKERPSTRFGLVANEFGEANIESQLLETRREPLFELPSGCLCCVSDGDLRGALKAVIQKDARIGHILVEASGLSSPGPLLGVLTNDDEFSLGGVFCLVDTTTFLQREKEFSAVRKQLAFADAVFLTKTDLCTEADSQAVRERLSDLNPRVRVLDAADRLPWSVLFATEHTGAEDGQVVPKRRFFNGGTLHDAEVLEYQIERPLDVDKLKDVLANLDPAILRAKGVLWLDDPSSGRYKYILQYTGAQKQLYSRRWASDEPKQTSLVFLGSSFDASALRDRLDGCTSGPST